MVMPINQISSDKYIKDGIIDEDLLLKDLLNIKHQYDVFIRELEDLYKDLNQAQKLLQATYSSSYRSHQFTEPELLLKNIMKTKEEIKKLNDQNMYPLLYFAEKADHLRMLKNEIKKDEYLDSEWKKLLMYMRMKDKQ